MTHGQSLTPGSVYRTSTFLGPWKIIDCPYAKWQRVTDPNAPHDGARKYLPNPINTFTIQSMKDVDAAEVCIEMWGGHTGTSAKQIRINESDWMDLTEPLLEASEIPEAYQYFRYPVLEIEPSALREGENHFQLTCGPQRYNDFGWGQWGIYGVSFRTYLRDRSAGVGSALAVEQTDNGVVVGAQLHDDPGMIDRIDYVGFHDDFDHHGEGMYRDWHYRLRYGERLHTLATSFAYPHCTHVDTAWIPTQNLPSSLVAVITDYNGLSVVTDKVDLVFPDRNDVRMFKPTQVPPAWQTRDGQQHSCEFHLDLDLDSVEAAQLTMATWNGFECDSYAINDVELGNKIGRDHDFDIAVINVPITALREGHNVFSTRANTQAHGIEVLWPGPVLKIMAKITHRRNRV